jgi:hypothetical protein
MQAFYRQLFLRIRVVESMPRRSGSRDVIFEGVLIPKGTRSAKLAEKGISDVEEMGEFLTAVFSDTLRGKIKLPPEPNRRVAKKLRMGLEPKLKEGRPIRIRAKSVTLNEPLRAEIIGRRKRQSDAAVN